MRSPAPVRWEKDVSGNISRTYETGPYLRHFGGSAALIALRCSYACSTPITTDHDGRLVAEVFSQGTNINLSLVQSGHAVAYQQYLSNCNRNSYLDAEQSAQQRQSTFWADPNPVMP